jgi:ankyrin repeat protein
MHSARLLVCAAGLGTVDVERVLVNELGAKVNDRMKGYTPLNFAVQKGSIAVVKCLVRLIASVALHL